MESLKKIKDIKCVINEFYHAMKCSGDLTNDARTCWLMYQNYCEEIKKDLERLEKVEKDLSYLKEQNIEVFQVANGKQILGIDITNMPSEKERIERIIKETLKEVLGND